ncbi:MAG: hypothetical protein A2167_05975 [Planctomycetes bacterium RBG_13_46_10]|nr:MAG: hypothetical protein A2167_05975 [Planctomycetes bacterium RBG_13_46_10]
MIDDKLQNQSPKRTLTQWLFNPFQFIAGGSSLLLGVLIILITAYIGSLSNTHFDGVLDVHLGKDVPLWLFLAEVLIDWLCLSIVLLITAFIVSQSSFRIIDIFGTQALARAPYLLAALLALPKGAARFGEYLTAKAMNKPVTVELQNTDVLFFAVMTIVTLLMLIWMVVLMYRAYSVSCNLKGRKALISFVVSLVLAEALSKIAIWQLFVQTGISICGQD